MESLKITCPSGHEFIYVNELPADLAATRLALTAVVTGKGKAGRFCFQYAIQEDVGLYYSQYLPEHDFMLAGEQNKSVCELHICLLHHFESQWDGIGQPTQLPLQFNLSYGRFVNNVARFVKGVPCATLDFHLSAAFLAKYYGCYPKLDAFIDSMEHRQYSQIEGVFIVNGEMRDIIRQILLLHSRPETQGRRLRIKIEDLFLAAMDHIHADKPVTNFPITEAMKDKAKQAASYLAIHLKDNFGVADVAQHVGTNVVSLNKAFKHCFHMTVAEYSRSLRLARAQHLILEGKLDMDAIADETGYCDGAALHHAFVSAVGVGPLKFREQHAKK